MITVAVGVVLFIAELFCWLNNAHEIALGVIYLLFGAAFLYYGINVMHGLEKAFPSIHSQYKCHLTMSTFLLCLPITFFAFLILARVLSGSFREQINRNNSSRSIYNVIIYIIGNFVPLWTQFATLVFGWIRRDITKRKESAFLIENPLLKS